MENIKEQLEEVIKKILNTDICTLPKCNDSSCKNYGACIEYCVHHEPSNLIDISKINTSLIADEVLKVVDDGISELTYYYKNKAVDEIEEDVAYIKVDEIINLLHNFSPNKENKNNERI
jgi:hypothetical protein